MADWYVGQKVVCIKRGRWEPNNFPGDPKYGDICTIRAIRLSRIDGGIVLNFEGIINPPLLFGDEIGYYAYRFRPLVNQDADISVFTSILDKLNERVSA